MRTGAGLTAGVVLAVGAAFAVALAGGGDPVVVAKSDPPAVGRPAGLQSLGLVVDGPASVAAGEPARFTVSFTDGAGIFSGSSEDWGDDLATSSRKQGRCGPGAAASPPAAGTYTLRHTWSEPGTYSVVIGVATYTCASGSAVAEEAARTLTVEVLPGG